MRAYARTDVRIAYMQCSDKIRFPKLRIKCGVAKSCPGTHTVCRRLWFSLEPRLSVPDFVSQLSRKTKAARHNPGFEATDADAYTHCVLPLDGLLSAAQFPESKLPSAGTGARNSTKLQKRQYLTRRFHIAIAVVSRCQIQPLMTNVALTAVD